LEPPATSTAPLESRLAVCNCTAVAIAVAVAVQVVPPFHSSAVPGSVVPPELLAPPDTSTFVPESNVAVCRQRTEVIVPALAHVADVPDDGMVNTSAVPIGVPLVLPPVMSTLPPVSAVAVWLSRAVESAVVVDHALVEALNSCTLVVLVVPVPVVPPAMRTRLLKLLLLLVSNVAVWNRRAVAMFVDTAVQLPIPVEGL
jgi:hypothetical protein